MARNFDPEARRRFNPSNRRWPTRAAHRAAVKADSRRRRGPNRPAFTAALCAAKMAYWLDVLAAERPKCWNRKIRSGAIRHGERAPPQAMIPIPADCFYALDAALRFSSVGAVTVAKSTAWEAAHKTPAVKGKEKLAADIRRPPKVASCMLTEIVVTAPVA